jgi:hypothetical protein
VLGGRADSLRSLRDRWTVRVGRRMNGARAEFSVAGKVRGERIRRLFTPFDARADLFLVPIYSWYRLRPTWWAPAKSKDTAACARSFRMPPFGPERRRA